MILELKKLNCLNNRDFSFLIRLLLGDFLNDSDSDSLFHISDNESSEGWVLGEGLNTHWLDWVHNDDGGLVILDELWLNLNGLTSSSVDLFNEGGEFTGTMDCMTMQDRGVSNFDLTWVVHDDYLSHKGLSFLSWVLICVGGDVSSSEILDGQSLDVETRGFSWLDVI